MLKQGLVLDLPVLWKWIVACALEGREWLVLDQDVVGRLFRRNGSRLTMRAEAVSGVRLEQGHRFRIARHTYDVWGGEEGLR